MLYKDVKMEKRSKDEPKFNKNNKTDRKILFTILLLVGILLLILGAVLALYFIFF